LPMNGAEKTKGGGEMNTTTSMVPVLKPDRDWVFILDHLELAFERDTLINITKMWNDGVGIKNISEFHKRRAEEILLALLHQSMRGVIVRPFAFRY